MKAFVQCSGRDFKCYHAVPSCDNTSLSLGNGPIFDAWLVLHVAENERKLNPIVDLVHGVVLHNRNVGDYVDGVRFRVDDARRGQFEKMR